MSEDRRGIGHHPDLGDPNVSGIIPTRQHLPATPPKAEPPADLVPAMRIWRDSWRAELRTNDEQISRLQIRNDKLRKDIAKADVMLEGEPLPEVEDKRRPVRGIKRVVERLLGSVFADCNVVSEEHLIGRVRETLPAAPVPAVINALRAASVAGLAIREMVETGRRYREPPGYKRPLKTMQDDLEVTRRIQSELMDLFIQNGGRFSSTDIGWTMTSRGHDRAQVGLALEGLVVSGRVLVDGIAPGHDPNAYVYAIPAAASEPAIQTATHRAE